MNVQSRSEFNAFLKDLASNEIKVFDTETNGLKPYNGNQIISLSVYFPEVNRAYNLPFRYGQGKIDVRYNESHFEGMPFATMNWAGNAKKDLYLQYWFNKFKAVAGESFFQNLPIEWLEEVKAAWGKGIYLGHNSRFDLHFLYTEGFPDVEAMYDTMVCLHIVSEDWGGIELDAPYTYTAKDATNGRCAADDVGTWAVAPDGTLLTRKQPGRRGLKWQAARIGLAGATEGERGLRTARKTFEDTLVDFIMQYWDDPMNDGLFTKAMIAALDGSKPNDENFTKAWAKVRAKIEIHEKANMWMLPSSYVAHYAELDVILTWGVYNWCLPILQEWDNIELFEKISSIHHKFAWEAERSGIKLNRTFAEEEIAKLEPMISDLEYTIDLIAKAYGLDGCNPNSPMQLLPLLNSGVLTRDFDPYYWPSWFREDKKLNLKTYARGTVIGDWDLQEQFDPIEGTAKSELDAVADHGLVRLIREHRMLKKSVDTYLLKWLKVADKNDYVHPSFNVDGTVAGRMSSSGDAGNMQNVPDRNGYTIKRSFVVPSDEWALVAIDYSTLELRLATWVAEGLMGFDPNMTMTNLFLGGKDLHNYTRDMLKVRETLYGSMTDEEIMIKLGYNLSDPKYATAEARAIVVNKDRCRYVAKTANFGLLYSGGAPMLSKLLKLDDMSVAKTLVNGWRNLYPAFPKANRHFTELAQTPRNNPSGKKRMFVQQFISGRFRKFDLYSMWKSYFRDGVWQGYNVQEAAQRKVFNNIIQGEGGMICTWSGFRINDELGTDKIKIFANIHDALEAYVRKDSLHLVPEMVKIMEDWPMVTPALKAVASASTSGNWQDMVEIKDMNTWIKTGGQHGYAD